MRRAERLRANSIRTPFSSGGALGPSGRRYSSSLLVWIGPATVEDTALTSSRGKGTDEYRLDRILISTSMSRLASRRRPALDRTRGIAAGSAAQFVLPRNGEAAAGSAGGLADARGERSQVLEQLGRLEHLEVHAERGNAQRQPPEIVVAGPVPATARV